jgi:hypothetical protein
VISTSLSELIITILEDWLEIQKNIVPILGRVRKLHALVVAQVFLHSLQLNALARKEGSMQLIRMKKLSSHWKKGE